jgi:hypothetical protein
MLITEDIVLYCIVLYCIVLYCIFLTIDQKERRINDILFINVSYDTSLLGVLVT